MKRSTLTATILALFLTVAIGPTDSDAADKDTTRITVYSVTANDTTVYEPERGYLLIRAALNGRCEVLEAREREAPRAHAIITTLNCPTPLVESAKPQN